MSRELIRQTVTVPETTTSVKILPEERNFRTNRSVKDYEEKGELQHILDRPSGHIGSTDPIEVNRYILNFETRKLELRSTDLAQGLEHIFVELLSNAGDNADETRRFNQACQARGEVAKFDVGGIYLWFNPETGVIRIRNQGYPIPVAPASKEPRLKEVVPRCIFGILRTGSNYSQEYVTMCSGHNGVGSKLTNIFSKWFTVRVGDSLNRQYYEGHWKNNMTEYATEIITPGYQRESSGKYARDAMGQPIPAKGLAYTGESFVEVEYLADLARFGIQQYPDYMLGLLAARLLFVSQCCKVPVYINDIAFDVRRIRDYAALIFDDVKGAIVHYEWPQVKIGRKWESQVPPRFEGLTSAQIEKLINLPQNPNEIPCIEVFALDAPYSGITLSTVNGQITADHGTHVDEAVRAISVSVLENVNAVLGKEKDISKYKLNISHVRPHISLIVNIRIIEPKFATGNTKSRLTNKIREIALNPSSVKQIGKWQLLATLHNEMSNRITHTGVKETNKKGRRGRIVSLKGVDANWAGGKHSLECVLALSEGDSGANYSRVRGNLGPNGKDAFGFIPGKGKFINILNATPLQAVRNSDIKLIKQFTGLEEGMNLENPEDLAKLRYGFILLMSDADKDGQHIRMLWINYFWRMWPSLFKLGRIGYLQTPYARVLSGKNKTEKCHFRAYSQHQLDDYLLHHPLTRAQSVKYYKGLGSSRDKDIEEDLTSAFTIRIYEDPETLSNLDLAFQKSAANARKEWLAKWREVTGVPDVEFESIEGMELWKDRSITSIINYDLSEYTKESVIRAIPSLDGFKESQRKAVYASMLRWIYSRNIRGMKGSGEIKLDKMTNDAISITHYQHGPKSMGDAFVKMTHSFVGSNNLPLFTPEAQTGSRDGGGSDGADFRYVSIDIAPWMQYAFYEEYTELVDKRQVEGQEAEPIHLAAMIPMHLINGCVGIATGFSTDIPAHNPYEIIDLLLERCRGTQFNVAKFLRPFYSGFKGRIEMVNVGDTPLIQLQDDALPVITASDLLEDEEYADAQEAPDEINEEDLETLPAEVDYPIVEETPELPKVPFGAGYRTYGSFKTLKVRKTIQIVIDELPIGRWTKPYSKQLEKWIVDGELKNFRDMSGVSKYPEVYFELEGLKSAEAADVTSLKLRTTKSLCNMHLTDDYGYPTKFRTTIEILEAYYQMMIPIFAKARLLRLERNSESVHDREQRMLFINSVNQDRLIIRHRDEASIYQNMDVLGIEHKYYGLIKVSELSETKVAKLAAEIAQLKLQRLEIETSTPQSIWTAHLEELRKVLYKEGYCLDGYEARKKAPRYVALL